VKYIFGCEKKGKLDDCSADFEKKMLNEKQMKSFLVPKLCDTYTNSCQCDPSPAEETKINQLSKDFQDVYHVDN